MFDGGRDYDIDPPSRSGGVFVLIGLVALFWCFVAFIIVAASAHAQAPLTPPSGQPVFNQALSARALTKSDTTVFTTTRGLFIGDATACDVALRLVGDASPVTFTNVQSGALLPFSAIQLFSAGTTCASVIALY